MATQTFLAAPSNTTDALFRDWALKLSNAITAVGVLKTADTGQIDFSTVTTPTTANSYRGYEIRVFNDTNQSAAPVYLKIEYGSSSFGNTCPGIRLTVGSGSNGSGSLTGNQATTTGGLGVTTTPTTTESTCLVSGANNRIGVTMFATSTTTAIPFYFGVERSKDDNGIDTTESIFLTTHGGSNSARYSRRIPFVGGVPTNSSFVTIGAGGTTGTDGSNVATCPNFHLRGGSLLNPGLNLICYHTADVITGTIDNVSMYGVNRSYYFLGSQIANGGTIMAEGVWNSSTTLAMRWE